MLKTSLFFALLLVLLPGKVRAQDASDSLYSLPEVTIVATRFEISTDSLPARVTRIGRRTLERYAGRTVAEILAQHGTGFVRSLGPTGLSGLSLRGAGPGHTALLLDGQRLNDPQLGQIDLTLIPAEFLSSVDVLHGGGASRHGSDAVAGAIDLSMMSGETNTMRIATVAGAFGERSIAAVGSLGDRGMALTMGAELSDVQGDFAFDDRSSFPPRARRRSNADRQTASVYGKVRRTTPGSETRIAGWVMSSRRGLPPVAGAESAGERQWDDMIRLWASHRWQHKVSRTEVQASAQRSTIRYANPALEIDDSGVTRSVSIGGSHQRHVAQQVRARLGIDLFAQSADHPALSGLVSQSGAAAHILFLLPVFRHTTVFPAVRSDWLVRDGQVAQSMAPSLRIRVAPDAWRPLAIKAGLERSFRFPTFNDLHWNAPYASGNPALKPETGVSTDLGIEIRSGAASAELTAFYQSLQDRITWLPSSDGIWRPRNIGRAVSAGFELSAAAAFRVVRIPLRVDIAYEKVDARDRSDPSAGTYGKQLRYVPRHTLRSGLAVDADAFSAGLSLRVVGERFITEDASESLPAYGVFDLITGWRVQLSDVRLDLSAILENVGNAAYQPVAGYPMPPRHLRFKLRATI
ncbi:MAG: TonB-dependent receptor [Rhodothermia bacterium]|nr:TonB-dependent receptor [Rhodothermia bacterium]